MRVALSAGNRCADVIAAHVDESAYQLVSARSASGVLVVRSTLHIRARVKMITVSGYAPSVLVVGSASRTLERRTSVRSADRKHLSGTSCLMYARDARCSSRRRISERYCRPTAGPCLYRVVVAHQRKTQILPVVILGSNRTSRNPHFGRTLNVS